ncbi:hypothetical protein M231_02787 [Tremella mesenterica]|uniref:Uncharacterized protein n=1 Tax=Tremella mesenterica TaxID=5217 RepID=A0A4Q1BQB2_TREME|nr:hypothetical protein M231_02787 [Tremella mesenterica]
MSKLPQLLSSLGISTGKRFIPTLTTISPSSQFSHPTRSTISQSSDLIISQPTHHTNSSIEDESQKRRLILVKPKQWPLDSFYLVTRTKLKLISSSSDIINSSPLELTSSSLSKPSSNTASTSVIGSISKEKEENETDGFEEDTDELDDLFDVDSTIHNKSEMEGEDVSKDEGRNGGKVFGKVWGMRFYNGTYTSNSQSSPLSFPSTEIRHVLRPIWEIVNPSTLSPAAQKSLDDWYEVYSSVLTRRSVELSKRRGERVKRAEERLREKERVLERLMGSREGLFMERTLGEEGEGMVEDGKERGIGLVGKEEDGKNIGSKRELRKVKKDLEMWKKVLAKAKNNNIQVKALVSTN